MKKKIVLLLVVSLMLISMTVSAVCGPWMNNGEMPPHCMKKQCGDEPNTYYKVINLKRQCEYAPGVFVWKYSGLMHVIHCGCETNY